MEANKASKRTFLSIENNVIDEIQMLEMEKLKHDITRKIKT